MSIRVLLLAIFIFFLSSPAPAQNAGAAPKPTSAPDSPGDPGQGAIPDEMRFRMAMERAENEYRKFLEQVKELSDLSTEVAATYRDKGGLSAEDEKKVRSIEKLAKRILGGAGGSEVDDPSVIEQITLAEAVDQMNEAAANIKKSVTEETRYVVSASVIGSSNQIINLAQFIRRAIR